MTPLKTHSRIWTWLCVCPQDKNASRLKKVACIIFTSAIIAFDFSAIVASVAFIVKFLRSDFEGCLHALFQFIGYTAITAIMILALISRRKICWIFDELTKIHQKCKFELMSANFFHIQF